MEKNIDINLSIEEQIEKIKNKGLTIKNEVEMKYFLLYNGYFRINRYIKRMNKSQKEKNELFKIYKEDNLLRSILFKYVSIIELKLRGVLNDYYSNI